MGRPVTLFTGQWADLPLAELAPKVAAWGYDGLELACWGDHFEVDRAVSDPGYARSASGRSAHWPVKSVTGRPIPTSSTIECGLPVARLDDPHRDVTHCAERTASRRCAVARGYNWQTPACSS